MYLCINGVCALAGSPDYVLNTPLFQHVAISRGAAGDDAFHIIAMGAGQDRQHSRQVFLNARVVDGPVLSDHDIRPGGMLQFVLDIPEAKDEAVKVFTRGDLQSAAAAAEAPIVPAQEFLGQIEQQRREIDELRSRLQETAVVGGAAEAHPQQQLHFALEPVVQKHPISETGELDVGCGYSSNVHTGMMVLCVNLAIVCIMLALQVQKHRNGSGGETSGKSMVSAELLCMWRLHSSSMCCP
jgi:hypothetical protein